MNYNQALEYIHSLQVFGSIPGLERISLLLNKLGNPQDALSFVHVAGTNGKGSTSTMIAGVFENAGLKTGLYTSPYVVDFAERIQINARYIPQDDLARLCKQVKDTGVTVTEFEFITALAMLYFAEQKCDVVVLEVGLGGRFDATNIIKAPLCAVITHIDYDHTAVLGNTLCEIATEKCGIIKEPAPVVCYPIQQAETIDTIKQHTGKLILPDINSLEIVSSDINGNRFIYKGKSYNIKLIGSHQIYNAITAIEAVAASGIPVTKENISKGIENVQMPARLELISKNPIVFLDGAHNPDGANAICNFLKNYDGKVIAITGMMKDKNCESFLASTLKHCQSVITVTVEENPRSISSDDLAAIARKYCTDVHKADSYSSAIDVACNLSQGEKPIFVFGSLYLAAALRDKLKQTFNS